MNKEINKLILQIKFPNYYNTHDKFIRTRTLIRFAKKQNMDPLDYIMYKNAKKLLENV